MTEKRLTKKELESIRAKHEAWWRKHHPDTDEETLKEELDLIMAMEDSYEVATLTCDCGRIHEVEFTPDRHGGQGFAGCHCACGHKFNYE